STASTNDNGYYEFKNLRKKGSYQLTAQHVSMQKKTVEVNVNTGDVNADLTLADRAYFLEPLEVKSIRATEKAPFAKTNITKQEIEKINQGQDLPMLLSQTPSVVVNSDAGNGIGYTAMRIRGSD